MAKAFGEKLGVDVEFVENDWDNKILELDGKTIDCVWNGMTLHEGYSSMECTDAYLNNAQVVVLRQIKQINIRMKKPTRSVVAVSREAREKDEGKIADLIPR